MPTQDRLDELDTAPTRQISPLDYVGGALILAAFAAVRHYGLTAVWTAVVSLEALQALAVGIFWLAIIGWAIIGYRALRGALRWFVRYIR